MSNGFWLFSEVRASPSRALAGSTGSMTSSNDWYRRQHSTAAPACDYHASISQRRPASGPATAARVPEVALAGLGWRRLSLARNWSGWWESNPR